MTIRQRLVSRHVSLLAFALSLLLFGRGFARAQDRGAPPASSAVERTTSSFRETQLALRLELPDGERRFRATVVRREGQTVLLLTAAHCLGRDDRGRIIELVRGERMIKALVRQVIRNPSYEAAPAGSIPGADNALALIELQPEDEEEMALTAALRATTFVVSRPVSPSGEVLRVSMIDQKDRGHVVRAANYSNPKWLEWGPTYQPIPGDSGSGVFITAAEQGGEIKAMLVGVVTDRSPTGGGASLLFGREPWLVEGIAALEKLMTTQRRGD